MIFNKLLLTKLLILILFLSLFSSLSLAEPDLKSIIDRYQEEYSQTFSGKMEMRRVKPGKEDRILVFQIWSKGQSHSLIRFLAPAREKGTACLKLKDEMYMYLPSVSKTIRISGRQKVLDSDFSSSDILGINLGADYDFSLHSSELIDNMDHYVLVLKAKSRKATYETVKLWLRKIDLLPKKEEFYTISGKLLETLIFDNYNNIGGHFRPTRMIMKNSLVDGQYTVITILEANFDQDIPDNLFTLFNLGHGV